MPEINELAKASSNLTDGNERVVRQSPAVNNANTEVENIVEFCYQTKTAEDTTD
jgi:hypothetical protein